MRLHNTLWLLLVGLVISCNSPIAEHQNSIPTDSTVKQAETMPNNVASSAGSSYEESMDDCIFDQETQTDEFLKNVSELNNYSWDNDKRTATVILETGDTLLIYRGGCNHFSVAAEFRFRKDKTDYSRWSNVYEKVLWIANLLDKEFDYNELKQAINSKNLTYKRLEETETDEVLFNDPSLQEQNYKIERKLGPTAQIISLSYTIN
ncbi:hypothetical protein [Pontibacter oryzae]|uniref:Uncharacterized protein n=1 Tax=Pontibacter oryzae TaxID=2304593 RepID=A0A399SHQ1_9BACT|nr:hypothetical protein [Pontibacter oryzae]RIJ42554.1 hypothetical protein D1627_01455 [Pontibacter oryzae]